MILIGVFKFSLVNKDNDRVIEAWALFRVHTDRSSHIFFCVIKFKTAVLVWSSMSECLNSLDEDLYQTIPPYLKKIANYCGLLGRCNSITSSYTDRTLSNFIIEWN